MTTVVYLGPDEPYPVAGESEPWLFVEPFKDDGKFFGTGASYKKSGEWVGYASLAENDACLEKALAAALAWAEKFDVPVIHVRTAPQNRNPDDIQHRG